MPLARASVLPALSHASLGRERWRGAWWTPTNPEACPEADELIALKQLHREGHPHSPPHLDRLDTPDADKVKVSIAPETHGC